MPVMSRDLTYDQIVNGLVDRFGVPREKAIMAARALSSAPNNPPAPRRRVPKLRKVDVHAIGFRIICKDAGLPMPVCEYLFALPQRRYRFDFCWVEEKLALEVNGGTWRKGGGAHRGKGFLRDMDKLNLAQQLGYRVLQCTPQGLCSDETVALVRAALRASSLL